MSDSTTPEPTTKDQVLEAVKSGANTVKSVAEAIGKSETTARKALAELVEDGTVAKSEEGEFTARSRANHGYMRNTKDRKDADERDGQVMAFFAENGSGTKSEVAEFIGITPRAAYHALWRLRNHEQVVFEDGVWSLPEEDSEDTTDEAEQAS